MSKISNEYWIQVLKAQCEMETGKYYDDVESEGFVKWLEKKSIDDLNKLLELLEK